VTPVQAYLQQVKAKQDYQKLKNSFDSATEDILVQSLKHPNPVFRKLGVEAISKRKVQAFFVKIANMLDDDNVYVQQTARKALVSMSGGKDFGPLPGAECEQVQECIYLWLTWKDKSSK
jgi:hypothetical protein